MQIKTFCGTDITRIEEEINSFLSELKDTDVKFVSQSQGNSDYGHLYTISVWYSTKAVPKTAPAKKKSTKK